MKIELQFKEFLILKANFVDYFMEFIKFNILSNNCVLNL